MSEPTKTVTISIDGREIKAEASRNVLQVALESGIQVPYFCYHPYLSVPGNCRQCQVKVGMSDPEKGVKWMPKLQVSCNTRVAEGMVVDTRDQEVKRAQAANMEFLLINHPLDCPICDQVGECWLQEHAFTSGPGKTRFREEKVHFDKRVDVGPHVLLDKERCIQCTRCIRFCDEITKTSELALFSRSDHTEVDIFPGQPLDNPYSGNVVDICPVGALTEKEFRFKSRLWFLSTESSVCPGCARGCNITVWHRDGGVARLTPRQNDGVNQTWICDEGRLLGQSLAADERVREPRLGPAGPPAVTGAQPARAAGDWDACLDEAARLLQEAGAQAAVVLRGWATLEEGYLATRLLDQVSGGARVAVPEEIRGEDDDLLIRAEKTPNRTGLLSLITGLTPGLTSLDALLDSAARGELKTILVLGHDLHDADAARTDKALAAGLKLVVLAAHESGTTTRAHVLLPTGIFPEVEGSVVNFQGRLQQQKAAYAPPFLARAGVHILGALSSRCGITGTPSRPQDILDEIGRKVPAFLGVSHTALGRLGVSLPQAPPAGPR